MSATYLVRIDDVCPTMDWSSWDAVEEALLTNGIKPILAIVPDNHDEDLRVDPSASDFWDRARDWDRRGWTIAMHGYQHRYVTDDPGLIALNPFSEFAGLPRGEQAEKIRRALEIFEQEGLRPRVWVAPGHSFDAVTLDCLATAGVDVISDGFARRPYRDLQGLTWVPQQLWRFRWMPDGVWTVCCHPNSWSRQQVSDFRRDLRRFRGQIADLATVDRAVEPHPPGVWSALQGSALRASVILKRRVRGS